jgi:hypothetical protein
VSRLIFLFQFYDLLRECVATVFSIHVVGADFAIDLYWKEDLEELDLSGTNECGFNRGKETGINPTSCSILLLSLYLRTSLSSAAFLSCIVFSTSRSPDKI